MRVNEFGMINYNFWNKINTRYSRCRTSAFVVMPNHIHGIIEIIPSRFSLEILHSTSKPKGLLHELSQPRQHNSELNRKKRRKMLLLMVIFWYKMNVSKQLNLIRNTPGFPIWQRNYYEHIIRDQKSFQNITEYIKSNLSRWKQDQFM